jgi:N-acetylmuramoyl-L-alanine amidase
VFEKDPSRTTIIGSFQRSGVTYISLTDLVQVARLNIYENRESKKLEIKFPAYRIKATANNPFLVITGEAQRSVVQMPREILFAANSYFLPLDGIAHYLDLLLDTPTKYEPALRTIRIGTTPATAFDIPTIRFEPKSNGMLIRIAATKRLTDVESWLHQNNWLYVTVPEAHADTGTINALSPTGIVQQIIAIQSPTSVQLTFRVSGKIATTELLREESSNDLLLAIRKEGTEEKVAPESHPPQKPETKPPPVSEARQPPVTEPSQRDLQNDLEVRRKRWQLDVIVLDAGHGGKDWGAIGVTGVREKDVTLGVALKLGHLIQRNLKGVKVVYTRKDDRFVELDRRGQIANEAGGKLFISIHANSLPRKPSRTRGFEVYLLRPGRTEEAIAIAERENSVIQLEEGYEKRYKDLTDENFILITMAQSTYMRASEQFADLVQQELDTRTNLLNRGVKQAGFYVLVGASMPNVLLETAYISNREDELIVRGESGQQKIAESLLRAVKRYKEEYEKLLEEGRDLGQK